MNSASERESLIESYLRGELGPDDVERVEESILTNDEFFEELEAAEDDLIDEYVAGTLSAQDRTRFEERYFSIPAMRDRVNFAAALARYRAQPSAQTVDDVDFRKAEPRESTLGESTAGKAISLESGSGGFSRWRSIPPSTIKLISIAAAFVLVAAAVLLVKFAFAPGSQAQRKVVASVEPGSLRSGGQLARIEMPGDATVLELRLKLRDADYQKFQAVVVEADESVEVFTSGVLPVESAPDRIVVVDIPASALKPGDYQVELSGIVDGKPTNADEYNFRLTRRP
ncbi:MAG TPA: hypothetical protein VEZ90_08295 [Blastocatellia bacterium]|nr:hypothetical protein [Blastocatellia bacterium]